MVPEEWEVVPFGELADFKNGLNFNKDDDGRVIKVVGIPDFWQRTTLTDFSGLKTITCRGDVGESHMLRSGDLLFVRSNGNPELVGRCLFFPLVEEPISFSGFTIRGRVDSRRMLPEFAAGLLTSDIAKDQIRKGGGGTNISNLSQDILGGIPVVVPPLPEQQKIAEILSTWDRAIETTEALLANARTQKRALMQSLLKGELGLNGQRKPFNYRFGRLGSGIKLISGQHIDAEMVNELGEGTPYLTGPADFSDGEIYVTKFTTSPKVSCDRGDILITVKGSGTGKTIVADQSYCISRQLMAVRPVSFEPRWIRYVIEIDQEKYRSAAAGLIPGIGRSEILDKIVPVPSYDDQAQIAELIHTSEEIEKRELRSLQALRNEKKSLMQQLLTGKRRVVV